MIRTDTLEQMFDVAALTVPQPLPAGPRVGIVTHAGGPAILCVDACTAEGLSVPELSAETKQRPAAVLPPQAPLANPVDMLAVASPEQIVATIAAVAHDPGVDAIVAIYIPATEHAAEPAAAAIARAAASLAGRKALLAVFMASGEPPRPLLDLVPRVPLYCFPESAAFALARVTRYARWRARPCETAPTFADVRRAQTDELLRAYRLPVIAQRRVTTPEEAATAAAALGFSITLKGVAHTARPSSTPASAWKNLRSSWSRAPTRLDAPSFRSGAVREASASCAPRFTPHSTCRRKRTQDSRMPSAFTFIL